MTLYQEILQQPDIFANLYSTNKDEIQAIVKDLGTVESVFIAARGTSDNAARYAKYVWGAFNRLPVTLATPSLFSLYKKTPNINKMLVLGVSQSGQSPDLLAVLDEANKQNCRTMAITNDAKSPLARMADYVIDIEAGDEKAVAASKTYTAQLQSIAMLSAAWDGDDRRWEEIELLPLWAEEIIKKKDVIVDAVPRYRYMDRCVVLGRGFNYATVYEWSLKLKELTYVLAEPYSSADFQHGPIAMMSTGFPVFAIVVKGCVYKDMFSLLSELKAKNQVDLYSVSNQKEALNIADASLQIPDETPEWLSPIISIIPAQIFCYMLAIEKNINPDKPRGLTKITRTS